MTKHCQYILTKSYALHDIRSCMTPKPNQHIPVAMPEEYSIHSLVVTSSVVPSRFKELRMLYNLRRARKAADSYLRSPVNRDNAPISRIREPEQTWEINYFRIAYFMTDSSYIVLIRVLPHPEVLVSVVSFSITPYCPQNFALMWSHISS